MEHDSQQQRIRYVKPEVLDLGPVTAAVGGTCSGGGTVTGKTACTPGSWVAICTYGTSGGSTLLLNP